MKKIGMKLVVIGALCALALAGCATPTADKQVPASHIKATINGQPLSLDLPKNMSAEKIHFTASTNGAIEVEIVNIKAENDKDVIQMSGETYVNSRKADQEFWKSAIETGGGQLEKLAPK